MKISWGNHLKNPQNINEAAGYGYATDRAIASLKRLGHTVTSNDPTADVHIHFDQPHHLNPPSKDIYTIIFHPWESTQLLEGWEKKMNECDEIWAPSPLIAQWYRDLKLKPSIYVYEHGVDDVWTPRKREPNGTIKFLHLGSEAARKGGIEVMRAFRETFRNRDDVSLTLKMINPGWNLPSIGKANVINKRFSLEDTVKLFHDHDVYVYPSWGEGFGLTPLQAIATGMPTITVPAWAPYAQFLDPSLSIRSRLVESPWPALHPGRMFQPNLLDMKAHMLEVVENYDEHRDYAMQQTEQIKAVYNWDRFTKDMFEALENRL